MIARIDKVVMRVFSESSMLSPEFQDLIVAIVMPDIQTENGPEPLIAECSRVINYLAPIKKEEVTLLLKVFTEYCDEHGIDMETDKDIYDAFMSTPNEDETSDSDDDDGMGVV